MAVRAEDDIDSRDGRPQGDVVLQLLVADHHHRVGVFEPAQLRDHFRAGINRRSGRRQRTGGRLAQLLEIRSRLGFRPFLRLPAV